MFGLRRIESITPRRASDRFFTGEILIVDVRTAAEYGQVRVPGTIHIPLGELGQRIGEVRDDRPVAFICRSGRRSAAATRRAARRRPDVLNIAGGISAWQADGLPTARCPASARPARHPRSTP